MAWGLIGNKYKKDFRKNNHLNGIFPVQLKIHRVKIMHLYMEVKRNILTFSFFPIPSDHFT